MDTRYAFFSLFFLSIFGSSLCRWMIFLQHNAGGQTIGSTLRWPNHRVTNLL
jgi:hypothetical protein